MVGAGTIYSRISKVYYSLQIKGLGGCDGIAPHSFRATNVTKLLEGGHEGVSIFNRTGNFNPKGLEKYTNGGEDLGISIQRCISGIDGDFDRIIQRDTKMFKVHPLHKDDMEVCG